MPYFGDEEPFQFKALLLCGPEFLTHLPWVFLVSVITKPFLSYCGYKDRSLGIPSLVPEQLFFSTWTAMSCKDLGEELKNNVFG